MGIYYAQQMPACVLKYRLGLKRLGHDMSG